LKIPLYAALYKKIKDEFVMFQRGKGKGHFSVFYLLKEKKGQRDISKKKGSKNIRKVAYQS